MGDTYDKDFQDNLTRLSEIQEQLDKVRNAMFLKRTKGFITQKIDGINSYVEVQSKKYGQNKEKAAEVTEQYEQQLIGIKSEYEKKASLLTSSKTDFEIIEYVELGKIKQAKMQIKHLEGDEKEQKAYKMVQLAKKELEEAMKSGNVQKMLEKKSELKHYVQDSKIAQCKEDIQLYKRSRKIAKQGMQEKKAEIKSCEQECKQAIQEISNDKDRSLCVIPKQNIFQKMIAKISDKVNGARKFARNVIEPLKANVDYVQLEMLPEIQERVKSSVLIQLTKAELQKKQIQENIKDKSNELKEMTQTKVLNAKDKAKEKYQQGKESVTDILSRAKQAKNRTIVGIADKINEKVDKARKELSVQQGREAEAR